MCFATLFTVATIRNQLRCRSSDERIKKMQGRGCVYTMEFCSAVMKDEIVSFTEKWMELGLLTQINYHIFSHI